MLGKVIRRWANAFAAYAFEEWRSMTRESTALRRSRTILQLRDENRSLHHRAAVLDEENAQLAESQHELQQALRNAEEALRQREHFVLFAGSVIENMKHRTITRAREVGLLRAFSTWRGVAARSKAAHVREQNRQLAERVETEVLIREKSMTDLTVTEEVRKVQVKRISMLHHRTMSRLTLLHFFRLWRTGRQLSMHHRLQLDVLERWQGQTVDEIETHMLGRALLAWHRLVTRRTIRELLAEAQMAAKREAGLEGQVAALEAQLGSNEVKLHQVSGVLAGKVIRAILPKAFALWHTHVRWSLWARGLLDDKEREIAKLAAMIEPLRRQNKVHEAFRAYVMRNDAQLILRKGGGYVTLAEYFDKVDECVKLERAELFLVDALGPLSPVADDAAPTTPRSKAGTPRGSTSLGATLERSLSHRERLGSTITLGTPRKSLMGTLSSDRQSPSPRGSADSGRTTPRAEAAGLRRSSSTRVRSTTGLSPRAAGSGRESPSPRGVQEKASPPTPLLLPKSRWGDAVPVVLPEADGAMTPAMAAEVTSAGDEGAAEDALSPVKEISFVIPGPVEGTEPPVPEQHVEVSAEERGAPSLGEVPMVPEEDAPSLGEVTNVPGEDGSNLAPAEVVAIAS
eukprot:jgi/Mesvir1/28044/Mv04647-RA.1